MARGEVEQQLFFNWNQKYMHIVL